MYAASALARIDGTGTQPSGVLPSEIRTPGLPGGRHPALSRYAAHASMTSLGFVLGLGLPMGGLSDGRWIGQLFLSLRREGSTGAPRCFDLLLRMAWVHPRRPWKMGLKGRAVNEPDGFAAFG